jgi:DNA-binding transcriptional LysR family regulator
VDRLDSMKVFASVAQRMGFAAAARDLRMSPAAVSKHVAALEAHVGTRLFDRTTRKVGLTEAGRVYLERCLECLQALDDADASVAELARAPRGLLRVTAPFDFSDCLLPVVVAVTGAHPDLAIDLQLSNRVVDLVDEHFDVAIRVAPALDGTHVARPLARIRLAIFGSPAYLARHGRPRRPEDLAGHRALVFAEPRPSHELTFTRGRRTVRVALKNVIATSNHGDLLRGLIREGIGLGLIPSFLAHRDHAAGLIEPVLPDWSLRELRVFAVYPHRRFLSPKVRVFVEALRATFGDGNRDPWWPSESG